MSKSIVGMLVIGSPGSGKTTFCREMSSFFRYYEKEVILVNLDPASNEDVSNSKINFNIDIRTLVDYRKVMVKFSLGPNGAVIYCIKYLKKNKDWFLEQLQEHTKKVFSPTILLFDLPGQIELYSNYNYVSKIFNYIVEELKMVISIVQVVDGLLCSSDVFRFVEHLNLTVYSMLNHDLPHVCVVSKKDLLMSKKEILTDNELELFSFFETMNYQILFHILGAICRNKSLRLFMLNLLSVVQDYSYLQYFILDWDNVSSMKRLLNQLSIVLQCKKLDPFHVSFGAHSFKNRNQTNTTDK